MADFIFQKLDLHFGDLKLHSSLIKEIKTVLLSSNLLMNAFVTYLKNKLSHQSKIWEVISSHHVHAVPGCFCCWWHAPKSRQSQLQESTKAMVTPKIVTN